MEPVTVHGWILEDRSRSGHGIAFLLLGLRAEVRSDEDTAGGNV